MLEWPEEGTYENLSFTAGIATLRKKTSLVPQRTYHDMAAEVSVRTVF